MIVYFLNREESWSWLQNGFEVLLCKKISEAVSVNSIHTFSRSKVVNVTIVNLVNWQSETLCKTLRSIRIELSMILRILNQNEMYVIDNNMKNLTVSIFIIKWSRIYLLFINLTPPLSLSLFWGFTSEWYKYDKDPIQHHTTSSNENLIVNFVYSVLLLSNFKKSTQILLIFFYQSMFKFFLQISSSH